MVDKRTEGLGNTLQQMLREMLLPLSFDVVMDTAEDNLSPCLAHHVQYKDNEESLSITIFNSRTHKKPHTVRKEVTMTERIYTGGAPPIVQRPEPVLTIKIGNCEYIAGVCFIKTSHDSLEDRLKRIIRYEVLKEKA